MTNEEAIKILEYPVKKWSMEWDEREDGLSYYEAIDMAISALRQQDATDKDVGKNDPLTNADKIRSMSDEELVRLRYRGAPHCKSGNPMKCNRHDFVDGMSPCELCYYEWLQQPAEEDDHGHES